MGNRTVTFGPFRFVPAQRLLFREGEQVPLGGRALDILIALTGRPGEVVEKAELMRLVWPHATVGEDNLKYNIYVLRRALDDIRGGGRYIKTVRGRGYCLAASVSVAEQPAVAGAGAPHGAEGLPLPPTLLVGRDQVIEDLAASLPDKRCLTITGEGGVGKTALALALAGRLSCRYRDGVCFVDLSLIEDAEHVAAALGRRLGLSGGTTAPQLVEVLRDRQMLLLIDTCEHVIDAVAVLAGELLGRCPSLHVLATSREPLCAPREHVCRLGGLAVPPPDSGGTARAALAFASVRLFVERVAACRNGFRLPDDRAPFVSEICRRLDGNPLAIQLAAGRADVFGARRLIALMDEGWSLLEGGFRTAPPRQRSVRASHEWSYRWLTEPERAVLLRLCLLTGSFTVEAAIDAVGSGALTRPKVADMLARLVAKSLVRADTSGREPRFSIAESLCLFGRDKLTPTGDAREAG